MISLMYLNYQMNSLSSAEKCPLCLILYVKYDIITLLFLMFKCVSSSVEWSFF